MSNPNFPKDLDINPSTSSVSVGVRSKSDNYGYTSQASDIQRYGIAGRVWEAAYILNAYVDPPPNIVFDPPFHDCDSPAPLVMIELGSGSGMVGLSIARSLKPHQDLLILTDLPEVCPLLQKNFEHELDDSRPHEVVKIYPLSWGNGDHATRIASQILYQSSSAPRQLTHILCSDLVYFPELLAPLLRTLIQISSPPFVDLVSPPVLIISYKIRSLPKEAPFWSAFGLWFSFEPVLVRDRSVKSVWKRFGEDLEGPAFVFTAHRRPESFQWTVAPDDRDLLAGVGARGTMQCKGDDTFETLLFMMMQEAKDDDDDFP